MSYVATGESSRPGGSPSPCTVVYVAVGWWLIVGQALHHQRRACPKTLTAQLMMLVRDPHLASMGYYWMPLPMLVRIPFVLVLYPFHNTVMAGPGGVGPHGGADVAGAVPDRPYRRSRRRAAIWVVVIAYGLSPVTVSRPPVAWRRRRSGCSAALTVLGYVEVDPVRRIHRPRVLQCRHGRVRCSAGSSPCCCCRSSPSSSRCASRTWTSAADRSAGRDPEHRAPWGCSR